VHHPLTVEEEAALLRAASEVDTKMPDKGNPRFRDIVLFLLKTGLRDDELCNLEWSDLDWEDGLIKIAKKNVEETRSIPIAPSLVRDFEKRLNGKQPGEAIFSADDIEAFSGRLHIRGKEALLTIKAGEVDLPNLRIVARRSFVWTPKGTDGVVPMCAAIRSLLERLARDKTSNFIFAHRDGGACRVKLLTRLKKAQTIAGIKGRLRTHDLRHTLALRLRRDKGVPLETIMGILRHSDIRETLIYAPYSLEEGRAAMRTLDEGTDMPAPVFPINESSYRGVGKK
jgi:integrase